MADLPPYPDESRDKGSDTIVPPDRSSPPSTPLWVKVFGIIFIILVLLFLIIHLIGGGLGGHTP